MLSGEVVEFDRSAGLGTVRGDDGVDYRFHAVEILDGTRSVEVGRLVRFQRLPKFGRFEAGGLY